MNHLSKFVITLICITSLLLSFPFSIAFGREYAKQLSDERDIKYSDVDIKTIYIKDDRNTIYFKSESWVNWNLEDNDVFMFAYAINTLNTNSFDDCQYLLGVMELEGTYVSILIDAVTDEIVDIQEETGFTHNNAFGIMSIKKSRINLKSSRFSFSAGLILPNDIDTAPEDGFCHYTPGPSTGKPKLELITRMINFGEVQLRKKATSTIQIANDGEGILTGTITSKSPEVKPSVTQLELDEYETAEIPVVLNTNDMQPGDFTSTLEINTNGGNDTITVNAEILKAPELVCDTESIDFGLCFKGERKSEKLKIKNKHKGPITGTVKSQDKWLIVGKGEFEGNFNDITLTLSSKSLDYGEYETSVTINSDGGNKTIPVTVQIEPLFELNVEKLDFGSIILEDPGDIPSQSVIIKNHSSDEQTLSISIKDDWVQIPQSTIQLEANAEKELIVSVQIRKITKAGYFTTSITLENKNESIDIPVILNVQSQPPLLVWLKENQDQESISGEITLGKTFESIITISNDGYGTCQLKAYLKEKSSPIRLFMNTSTLKRQEKADLKIKLDAINLTETGLFSNTLVIESNGGNLTIPISVQVLPKKEVVIVLTIGFQFAYINDQPMKLDAPPYIKQGSTMVPLRFISEAMKAEVKWENIGKGRILISMKSISIQLDIGSTTALVNGKTVYLTAAPEIVQSRTFVPLRFVGESMGAQIEWEAATQKITIRFTED